MSWSRATHELGRRRAAWQPRAVGLCAIGLLVVLAIAEPAWAQATAPRLFLDQPERIVEYQLNRLTRDELALVERRDTDPRYRPVYVALLTRDGLPMALREEAVAALVRLAASTRSRVLLDGLGRLTVEADATARQLIRLLLQQATGDLVRDRGVFTEVVSSATASGFRVAGAYGGLIASGEDIEGLWAAARSNSQRTEGLLRAASDLPALPALDVTRRRFAGLIGAALDAPTMAVPGARAAALSALASLRPDADTATTLARELRTAGDETVRAAAARGLMPLAAVLPAAELQPAVDAIAGWVQGLSPQERATAAATDALALAEALAARLPADGASSAKRRLRSLGARVVRITSIPEQVSFDVRWFVVEAGRAVQVVLVNPDAMPHNLVIGLPGSLEKIGTAASALSLPSDPDAKPFVPDLPEVLFATRLAQQDETLRLAFTAPAAPGAYVFACTFPGHWARMYGVMLVVPDLEAWEAAPAVPRDPLTGQPLPPTTSGSTPSR